MVKGFDDVVYKKGIYYNLFLIRLKMGVDYKWSLTQIGVRVDSSF